MILSRTTSKQPVWITPAGSLGTIPEGVFYQIQLATTGTDPGDIVYYKLIAGEMPNGFACSLDGSLGGVPTIQNAASLIGFNITNEFVIRAYTIKVINGVEVINRFADQTFSVTVTGQYAPEFVTPEGLIGQYYTGTYLTETVDGVTTYGYQIEYTDADVSNIKLISGLLPPGISINSSGYLSGIFLNTTVPSDQYPVINPEPPTVNTYTFTLEVTNGIYSNIRTFWMTTYNSVFISADNTYITADNTFITADNSYFRAPVIIPPSGSIGTTPSDVFFAFQFKTYDVDGNTDVFGVFDIGSVGYDETGTTYDENGIGYDQGINSIPPNLVIDPNSGWFYGYIPDLGLTDITYNFLVVASKANNPTINSGYVPYSLTVQGSIDTQITWITPSDLGYIENGAISTLHVEAVSRSGIQLYYRLAVGTYIYEENTGITIQTPEYNLLPQGLELLPSGDIVGRVSFNTFTVDGGSTTFDIGVSNAPEITTFDLTYHFTVNVYSADGYVNFNKDFTIHLIRRYNEPYENLYIQAMAPLASRKIITALLTDQSIFPVDLLYRPDDANFGLAKNVTYYHAYGLTSATYDEYMSSLYINHYWKTLTLGEIETAQALDDSGNVIYEVVYSRIIDNLVNQEGESVGKDVLLPYPTDPLDPTGSYFVHPNALVDMRDQVIDVVGQISNVLPHWMLSKQPNGQILGFTPAWVIAYTKPGKSAEVVYNIQTQYEYSLNSFDFEVDRYELDAMLSVNWNPVTKQWNPTPPQVTTFDKYGWTEPFVYIGNVDYGTQQPFIELNYSTIEYINSIGGIDGPIDTNINGKTLIFVKQQDYIQPSDSRYPGPMDIDLAWTDYYTPFDHDNFDSEPFDGTYIIPGEEDLQVIPNERLGIYQISVTGDDVVSLTLIENTATFDYVNVIGGASYNYTPLYIPSVPVQPLTLITWELLPHPTSTPTTFDQNSMQFIVPVDMYNPTDEYNKYLVFPHRTILG